MQHNIAFLPLALFFLFGGGTYGFTAQRTSLIPKSAAKSVAPSASATYDSSDSLNVSTALRAEGSDDSASAPDPSEVVARTIVVTGDVDGGYYRSCVKNEASRFRNLIGTMTPPENSRRAEIYVEGKRKMVDGFVRWCKRGDVGLSQTIQVENVIDESPTGMFEDFSLPTGNKVFAKG